MQDEVVFPAFGIKGWVLATLFRAGRGRRIDPRTQDSTHADRVKQIAPADYRRNTHLRMLLE